MKIRKKISAIVVFLFYFSYNCAQIVEPRDCSICADDLYGQQDVVTLACHPTHSFHISCLNDWFTKNPKSRCPFCMREYNQLSPENQFKHFAHYVNKGEEVSEQCGCLSFLIDLDIHID